MILIAGLGNPGKQYTRTRHNVGFLVIDQLIKLWQMPSLTFNKKFNAEITEGRESEQKIIFLKPQTFMNNSGQAIAAATKFYKIKPKNILIIHDDKDIPLGELKIQINRGDAGHNGIKSIIEQLGTKNFIRLRIGIKSLNTNQKELANFVLSKFTMTEQKILNQIILQISKAVKIIATESLERAMTKYNS